LITTNQNSTHFHTSSTALRIVVGPPGGSDGTGELRGGGVGGGSSSVGGDKTFGGNSTTSGGSSGGKDGQLCCPKCGNPCTHVETFVC
jgi:ATP-dependent Clp protease ATP-binding subunit ClpX